MVAMQAFIDESMADGKVLVLAGFVAPATNWASFSIEWADRLKEANLEEFHMTDRAGGPVEINGYFYKLVEKYAHCGICSAVPIPALSRVVDELRIPKEVANPYYYAAKSLVNLTAQHQSELGISEPIDFFFDEREREKLSIVSNWQSYVDSLPQEQQAVCGSTPVFGDSKKFLPLQAADMFAWHYRKRWIERGTFKGMNGEIFPWQTARDMLTFVVWPDEEHIRYELLKGRRRDMEQRMAVKFSHTFGGEDHIL